MAKAKTSKKEESKITVPSIDLGVFEMTLKGESPLMVNKFAEKAKVEMIERQTKTPKRKKEARNPKQEYLDSLYRINNNGKTGMPASGVKNCLVSACRFVDGIKMTEARGAFHVLATASGNLLEIKGKHVMDESIVRIGKFGNKVAMNRYRGRYDKWEVKVPIKFNRRVISPAQIVNLAQNAGFSVGLCEYRPEKNGSYGMFSVK
jgi:hypothetical protein